MNRVFVTGLGAITSIGHSIDEFWNGCLKGKPNVQKIPLSWRQFSEPTSRYYCPLRLPNYKEHGIKKFEITQNDPATLNAILATQEALKQANISISPQNEKKHCYRIDNYSPYKIGVFIGTGAGGINTLLTSTISDYRDRLLSGVEQVNDENRELKNLICDISNKLLLNSRRSSRFSLPMFLPNSVSAAVAIKFGIKGPVNVEVYSCASGSVAVGEAYKAIVNGDIDLAISGGSEYVGDDLGNTFRGFDALGTLATGNQNPQELSRPFDEDRSNFLFSEGAAGILILENDKRISTNEVKPLSEIIGYSRSFDSHHFMQPTKLGEEQERLIRNILIDTKLQCEEVDYINAHGTGTQLNDRIETSIFKKMFPKSTYINSTKSILGHTLGASGALEAIVSALSLHYNSIHPSINIDNPIEDLNFPKTAVFNAKIKNAISLSYGFGGHNVALMFKKCI